jgi:phosphoribosylamine--glycine ligase
MNVLIIGSGGREHALAWKISQSPRLNKIYTSPGNGGTLEFGENIALNISNFESIAEFAIKNDINLIVVGPEDPLVNGICDYFNSDERLNHINIIGPEKSGAALEGSKDYAKAFMQRHNIPTAAYYSVNKNNIEQGIEYLGKIIPPYVLKADGLAAGKGVVILDDLQQAITELRSMLDGKFGDASNTVVIEEYLSGIEVSVFVLTDGISYCILPEAKDYKRIGVGDTGLNTGGMGAISPVPFADKIFMKKVEERIIIPTIKGLDQERIPYKGFIFFGLMNVLGDPYVIEYNVRLGDPETEVVLPRIKSDFLEILEATAQQRLKDIKIVTDKRTVSTVMLVSGGYPQSYKKGEIITNVPKSDDCIVFHSGTKIENNKLLTNGGRVMAISAYGYDKKDALKKSYALASKIDFEGKYFREDIGFDL